MSKSIFARDINIPVYTAGTIGANGKYAKTYLNDILIDAVYEFDTDKPNGTTIDLSELAGTGNYNIEAFKKTPDNSPIVLGSGYTGEVWYVNSGSASLARGTTTNARIAVAGTTLTTSALYDIQQSSTLTVDKNRHSVKFVTGADVSYVSYRNDLSMPLLAGYIIRLRKL